MKKLHSLHNTSFGASAFILVFLMCFSSNAQTPIRMLINPSEAYFIGVSYSSTIRNGVYEFSDAQQSQTLKRGDLSIFGGQAGKRLKLNKHLRLQIAGLFEQGSVWDSDIIQYDFMHFGLEPQLQYTLPTSDNFTPYILIGTGINYLSAKEHVYLVSNGIKQEYGDLPNNNSNKVCMNVAAGFGIDFPLSPTLLFNAAYVFRYSQPVSYSDQLDFQLYPQNYHEDFYSSVFQVNLLFSFK